MEATSRDEHCITRTLHKGPRHYTCLSLQAPQHAKVQVQALVMDGMVKLDSTVCRPLCRSTQPWGFGHATTIKVSA